MILNDLFQSKRLWMFLPLALGFGLVAAFTHDIRNPVVDENYSCQVVGSGAAITALKQSERVLYTNTADEEFDVAFRCNQQLGLVIINDRDPFAMKADISPGNAMRLTHKTYRWIPERWQLHIALDEPATEI